MIPGRLRTKYPFAQVSRTVKEGMFRDNFLALISTCEADTQNIAETIAGSIQAPDIIALSGNLGTGKSVFARAIIHALGEDGEVPSPTFTLVQSYDLEQMLIHHLDLYRLENPLDAFELGIEEMFVDGTSLIEWPERLGDYLPKDRLNAVFSHSERRSDTDTIRQITLEGLGTWQLRIKELARKLDYG